MVKKKRKKLVDPFIARESKNYIDPIPSREFILSILAQLQEPGKRASPIKRQKIAKALDLHSPDQLEALRRRLRAMERDGQLYWEKRGYLTASHLGEAIGTLVIDKEDEGHIDTSERKVFLSGNTLRGYFDGDEVSVQIVQVDEQGNARGRINKLVNGITPTIIGRFTQNDTHIELISLDKKVRNIFILPEKTHQAKDGEIVLVKVIRDLNDLRTPPVGEVLEILGDFNTRGIEIKVALRKFGVNDEWPNTVIKESEIYKDMEPQLDIGREDLTQLNLVTIDGEDAKDFDDAVFCEPVKNGWELWVAIADVSYYVKPKSALDKEAFKRGNSTYLPGFVVPMLPEVLSNGLCSLKPNVPRLAVACKMEINQKGEIKSYKFMRALIHSKARLTYTEVAEFLAGNDNLAEKFKKIAPSIHALHEVYQALLSQRKKRGAIDFDKAENRILFNVHGKIEAIIPQTRNIAHRMIEESMLAANVSAASFIKENKVGGLFRVHDQPPEDKLNALRQFLSELGLDFPRRKKITSLDYATLLEQIQHREDKHMIETIVLRSLSQAQYSAKNSQHFGLGYENYLHFTSPIRRYPDLIVHRAISGILLDGKKTKANKDIDLEKVALSCSQSERRSDDASRDAIMGLKCHFMQDKVGEVYNGIISGVANFGLFVELSDIYVEGLLHITNLGQEYFYYDAAHHRLTGERSRTTYQLGMQLKVKVVRVDLEARKIDLELLECMTKAPLAKKAPAKKRFVRSERRPRRFK